MQYPFTDTESEGHQCPEERAAEGGYCTLGSGKHSLICNIQPSFGIGSSGPPS